MANCHYGNGYVHNSAEACETPPRLAASIQSTRHVVNPSFLGRDPRRQGIMQSPLSKPGIGGARTPERRPSPRKGILRPASQAGPSPSYRPQLLEHVRLTRNGTSTTNIATSSKHLSYVQHNEFRQCSKTPPRQRQLQLDGIGARGVQQCHQIGMYGSQAEQGVVGNCYRVRENAADFSRRDGLRKSFGLNLGQKLTTTQSKDPTSGQNRDYPTGDKMLTKGSSIVDDFVFKAAPGSAGYNDAPPFPANAARFACNLPKDNNNSGGARRPHGVGIDTTPNFSVAASRELQPAPNQRPGFQLSAGETQWSRPEGNRQSGRHLSSDSGHCYSTVDLNTHDSTHGVLREVPGYPPCLSNIRKNFQISQQTKQSRARSLDFMNGHTSDGTTLQSQSSNLSSKCYSTECSSFNGCVADVDGEDGHGRCNSDECYRKFNLAYARNTASTSYTTSTEASSLLGPDRRNRGLGCGQGADGAIVGGRISSFEGSTETDDATGSGHCSELASSSRFRSTSVGGATSSEDPTSGCAPVNTAFVEPLPVEGEGGGGGPCQPEIRLTQSLFAPARPARFTSESEPKICEYLGSFPADQDELQSRIDHVEHQINIISQARLQTLQKSAISARSCSGLAFDSNSVKLTPPEPKKPPDPENKRPGRDKSVSRRRSRQSGARNISGDRQNRSKMSSRTDARPCQERKSLGRGPETTTGEVALILGFSGLRVCSVDLEHTYTVHALRRICHATCEPMSQLFAFTARDAGNHSYQCHVFHTPQAEAIHSCFNQAFSNEMTLGRDVDSREPKPPKNFGYGVCDLDSHQENRISGTQHPTKLMQMALSQNLDFSSVELAARNKGVLDPSLTGGPAEIQPKEQFKHCTVSSSVEPLEQRILQELTKNVSRKSTKIEAQRVVSTRSETASGAPLVPNVSSTATAGDCTLERRLSQCSQNGVATSSCKTNVGSSNSISENWKAFKRHLPLNRSGRSKKKHQLATQTSSAPVGIDDRKSGLNNTSTHQLATAYHSIAQLENIDCILKNHSSFKGKFHKSPSTQLPATADPGMSIPPLGLHPASAHHNQRTRANTTADTYDVSKDFEFLAVNEGNAKKSFAGPTPTHTNKTTDSRKSDHSLHSDTSITSSGLGSLSHSSKSNTLDDNLTPFRQEVRQLSVTRARSRSKSRDRSNSHKLNPTIPSVQSVQSTLKLMLSSDDTHLSMDAKLKESGWFNKRLSHATAETILMHELPGTFIITNADSVEWKTRLKLVELTKRNAEAGSVAGKVVMELLQRNERDVDRWPIEFKEKLGWKLVPVNAKKPEKQLSNKSQPYFPHLFILCLHYGTNPGPLSCTLKLKQSTNPLYNLNSVKIGAAVQV